MCYFSAICPRGETSNDRSSSSRGHYDHYSPACCRGPTSPPSPSPPPSWPFPPSDPLTRGKSCSRQMIAAAAAPIVWPRRRRCRRSPLHHAMLPRAKFVPPICQRAPPNSSSPWRKVASGTVGFEQENQIYCLNVDAELFQPLKMLNNCHLLNKSDRSVSGETFLHLQFTLFNFSSIE